MKYFSIYDRILMLTVIYILQCDINIRDIHTVVKIVWEYLSYKFIVYPLYCDYGLWNESF